MPDEELEDEFPFQKIKHINVEEIEENFKGTKYSGIKLEIDAGRWVPAGKFKRKEIEVFYILELTQNTLATC